MSNSNNKTDITLLGDGFAPSECDVIVGRGKVCYKHSGNLRLARIVQSVLGTYSSPEATKKSKTELIKSIVTQVRESSPDGGFVKFDNEAGQWFEVGDRTAREKVSQAFRDALTDQYKSSSTSKTLKRRQERITRQVSTPEKGEHINEPLTPGGSMYTDPVASLPFGSMSLASPSPQFGRNPIVSPLSTISASPGPRSSFGHSPAARSLASQSPFSASPSPFSAAPSPRLALSLTSGLGRMSESPSSLRLAVAIAERKRRLTNLNMIIAARRNPRATGVGGGGFQPQVPQF